MADPAPDPGIAPIVPGGAPSIVNAGLRGLCPRCGATTLFDGILSFAPNCSACGLDFAAFNVGDGPAAFLTLILGAIVVALAITVELTFHPPLWVHMLIWIPFTAIGVVGALRLAKGALMAAEFRHDAREGAAREERIDPRGEP